jgi:hypothetical protein
MPRSVICLFPLLLAVVVGCGGTPLPPEADPVKGRQALTAALDTWVKGGKPADLQPVVVVDPDWEEGHKLVKYEVDPADGRAGVDLLLKVKLTLQKKDGRTQEKAVNFVVGINTQTVVLRYQ